MTKLAKRSSIPQGMRRATQDPVSSSSFIAAAILVLAVIGSAYGTWWVANNIIPSGSTRAGSKAAALNNKTSSSSIADLAQQYLDEEDLSSVRDYISGAIPFFMILMAIEHVLIKLSGLTSKSAQYSVLDTWSSVTAGINNTLGALILRQLSPLLLVYAYLSRTLTIYQFPEDTWYTFALAFTVTDFAYYLFHRAAHEYSILWAGHNLHHSSEHYNLSTALRQGYWQALTSPIWYLPMAPFFSLTTFLKVNAWVTLYQFWIHTCLVRKMPWWFELVMNTPSHHRIHHDRRVHKNFAGVFIIWDRMCGSFYQEVEDSVVPESMTIEEEVKENKRYNEELCLFGHSDACESWSECAVQWQWWFKHLLAPWAWKHALFKTRNPIRGVWNIFAYGPGYAVAGAPRHLPVHLSHRATPNERFRLERDDGFNSAVVRWWIFAHFLYYVGGTFTILAFISKLSAQDQKLAPLIIMAALTLIGLIADGTSMTASIGFEVMRCALMLLTRDHFPFKPLGETAFTVFHVASLAVVCIFSSQFVREKYRGGATAFTGRHA